MTPTKYPRCTCGHSRTAHASCTWKPHERGECKAPLAPGNKESVLLDEYRCSCTQYTPRTK